jgi:hypothetical protein
VRLADIPKVLLRRWYVTVVGVIITTGLLIGAFVLFPASQQVDSRILLLPPKSTVGTKGNPYLGLGGLKQPVDVLVRALTSQEAALEVERRWPSATYLVEPDYTTNGPILVITVEDRDAKVALDTTAYLLEQAPKTLDALQAGLGVRPNSRITSTVITRDAVPKPVRKAQLRALVVAFGVGLALTALAAAAVDGLVRRRRQRAMAEVDAGETELKQTRNGRPVMAEVDAAETELKQTRNGRPVMAEVDAAETELKQTQNGRPVMAEVDAAETELKQPQNEWPLMARADGAKYELHTK